MTEYVKPSEASKALGVTLHTLRRWGESGKIDFIKVNGQRRYNIQSVTKEGKQIDKDGDTYIYGRVSGKAQKPDLDRQVAHLVNLYPTARVVTDIGSGLNYKRKGLRTLLGYVLQGSCKRIVVAHKDRLCRFGYDLIKWLCEQNGCEILVLNQENLSPEREMVEDILAIIHVFSCRLYGLRKYKAQIKEDPDLPKL